MHLTFSFNIINNFREHFNLFKLIQKNRKFDFKMFGHNIKKN